MLAYGGMASWRSGWGITAVSWRDVFLGFAAGLIVLGLGFLGTTIIASRSERERDKPAPKIIKEPHDENNTSDG
jgi:hypothetical protein